MPSSPEENPYDPWEPGEPIDDVPEFAEDAIDDAQNPPSGEEVEEFFSDPNNVEDLMKDIAAQQRTAALGKAAEARAKEIYAQQEEKQRRQSPHRVQLSGEALNPETGMWEKMHDDD